MLSLGDVLELLHTAVARIRSVRAELRARVGGAASQRAELKPIGFVRSSITRREQAPRQGNEGAPAAWLELDPTLLDGTRGIQIGAELIVITWFHEARRDVLQVHPRDDAALPLTGVFATRSPDRPNPLGLHRVTVLAIRGRELQVAPLEALDGTPIADIKCVLSTSADA
jgi:tRNA-Thr(GGU) m(6)t(6)A37 methyltransferase TsaA